MRRAKDLIAQHAYMVERETKPKPKPKGCSKASDGGTVVLGVAGRKGTKRMRAQPESDTASESSGDDTASEDDTTTEGDVSTIQQELGVNHVRVEPTQPKRKRCTTGTEQLLRDEVRRLQGRVAELEALDVNRTQQIAQMVEDHNKALDAVKGAWDLECQYLEKDATNWQHHVAQIGTHLPAAMDFFHVDAAGPQIPFHTAALAAAVTIERMRTGIAQFSAQLSASHDPAEWFGTAVLAVKRQELVLAEYFERVIATCRSEHEWWVSPTGFGSRLG